MHIAAIFLLSALFLFASSIKIWGWQKFIFETQFGMFQKYGLNRKTMFLVGLVELFGALAIWMQSSALGPIGALALLGTSIGAIFCHLRWATWKDAIPALITGTLSAAVFLKGSFSVLRLIGF